MPASVVNTLAESTFNTRQPSNSPMYRFPALSNVTANGLSSLAVIAGLPSPPVPPPATSAVVSALAVMLEEGEGRECDDGGSSQCLGQRVHPSNRNRNVFWIENASGHGGHARRLFRFARIKPGYSGRARGFGCDLSFPFEARSTIRHAGPEVLRRPGFPRCDPGRWSTSGPA